MRLRREMKELKEKRRKVKDLCTRELWDFSYCAIVATFCEYAYSSVSYNTFFLFLCTPQIGNSIDVKFSFIHHDTGIMCVVYVLTYARHEAPERKLFVHRVRWTNYFLDEWHFAFASGARRSSHRFALSPLLSLCQNVLTCSNFDVISFLILVRFIRFQEKIFTGSNIGPKRANKFCGNWVKNAVRTEEGKLEYFIVT